MILQRRDRPVPHAVFAALRHTARLTSLSTPANAAFASVRCLWLVIGVLLCCCGNPLISRCCGEDVPSRGDLLIVQGVAGEEEYGKQFSIWSERWLQAAAQGSVAAQLISPESAPDQQKAALVAALEQLEPASLRPLWVVLIGHGTYDRRTAKFNLNGPDLSAQELDQLLTRFDRPVVVINCASASAPFLEVLSQPGRIVITSTRSGEQVNFSRFGDYLSQAIADPAADLDKDLQTSLLEAFLMASRKTLEFYDADGRIPTEHALLDDNGDGQGTRANAFRGFRVVARAEEAGRELDGLRAHQLHLVPNEVDSQLTPEQLARRNEIEQQIEQLRQQKSRFPEDEYYAHLEVLFLELAEVLLPARHLTTADSPAVSTVMEVDSQQATPLRRPESPALPERRVRDDSH